MNQTNSYAVCPSLLSSLLSYMYYVISICFVCYFKFILLLDYFWGDIKNQADFFHQVAAKHKLNPLAPADWYSLDVETILESKVPLSSLPIPFSRFSVSLCPFCKLVLYLSNYINREDTPSYRFTMAATQKRSCEPSLT